MTAPDARALPFHPRQPEELRACLAQMRTAGSELAGVPLADLLGILERAGQLWRAGGPYAEEARACLSSAFQPRVVGGVLRGLADALRSDVLADALQHELGRPDLLDRWAPDSTGTALVRGYPLGLVAQVLAGNVFLGGAMALAQALLTRNAVVLKLSREDSGFTALFARSLHEAGPDSPVSRALAVCAWDSAQDDFNQVLREEADAVVVWGGSSAVAAYPAERCRGRVIHHGPRLGIGFVLAGADLDRTAAELAWDVALWEQRACSSPRLLFVEETGSAARTMAQRLTRALAEVQSALPARPLGLDEKSEVLALREQAQWLEDAELFATLRTLSHTVLLVGALPAAVPVGHRTVLVVPLKGMDDIPSLLNPYRGVLQTAVLAAPAARWPAVVAVLVRAGFTQVAAAGSAASRFLGLPHEGEFALRRLVQMVGVDLGAGPLVYPGRPADSISAVAGALAGQ
jgi:hypothetical protein